MADDDEDVVLEGSALHQHLLDNGYDQFETISPTLATTATMTMPPVNTSCQQVAGTSSSSR